MLSPEQMRKNLHMSALDDDICYTVAIALILQDAADASQNSSPDPPPGLQPEDGFAPMDAPLGP
jgi:hypothetical protein